MLFNSLSDSPYAQIRVRSHKYIKHFLFIINPTYNQLLNSSILLEYVSPLRNKFLNREKLLYVFRLRKKCLTEESYI